MYIFYLLSAVALSTGVGAFAQYDTLSRTKDAARDARVHVTSQQQHFAARTLRRQFQIDPSEFPAVAPGGYTKLDEDVVLASMNGGYLNTDTSSYYLSDQGEVIAVLDEGLSSPYEANGDEEVGVDVRPQFLTDFLTWILGDNFTRGPVIQEVNYDNQGGQETAENSYIDLPDFLSDQDISLIDPDLKQVIAQLNLDSLKYHELAGTTSKVLSSDPITKVSASLTQASYEVPGFAEVQSRLFGGH